MNKQVYISIAIVAIVLGLMMAFQFRTTSAIDRGVPLGRDQELTIEKKQIDADMTFLEEEAGELETKIEGIKKGRTDALGVMESELSRIRLYAGFIMVEGPGVEVILENPLEADKFSPYVVRDEDLLKVVNDLRGAGAEAISVNGQRILATSEVRFAGNHINVNLTKLSPPYKIAAIGNPGTLKSSLEIKGGLVEYLSANGIAVDVKQEDKLQVPAHTGPLRFEYAKHIEK